VTAGWKTFDDPRFEVRFRYPDPTPGGSPAQKFDTEVDGTLLVHHRTDDRELYVELRRLPLQSARDEYERHRPVLEARFGAGAVSELRPTTIAGRDAHAYGFRWPDGERVAIVFSTSHWTYRIIYNSASPLNEDVLATVKVTAP
jgi:hypothetical protein